MRKILSRIQDLGHKAEQIKAAAATVPARAAELRDTVLMSGAQLRQLRTELQSSVAALRADSDDRITRALGELNANAESFREAGYELDGVDLELGPAQRLIVHLEKRADVDPRRVRALLETCADQPTARAVLAACLKADETAGQVQLADLEFCELIVHAGPVPTVRLCWRAPAEIAASAPPPLPATATVTTAPTSPSTPASPSSSGRFGEKAFFESRGPSRPAEPKTAAPPPPVPPEPPAAVTETPTAKAAPLTPSSAAPTGPRPGGDWRQSALDRFKQMPDLSRPRSR